MIKKKELLKDSGMVNEDLFRLLRDVLSDAPYASLVADANRIGALPLGGGADMLVGVYLSLSMINSENPLN